MMSNRLWILLIAVTASLCYSNIFNNEFLFDDLSVIVENDAIKSFPNLPQIFLTPSYTSQSELDGFKSYRPVTTLSFALNYALHGIDPGGYHLLDVLIHLANSLLVYALVFQLFQRKLPAGITAVIFAVHPVQTEAVTGTFGRADELAAFFVLLGLIAYIKAWQVHGRKGVALIGLSSLCLLAGLASKESAASFITVLVAYEICFTLFADGKLVFPGRKVIYVKAAVIFFFLAIAIGYIFWWRPFVTGQFGDLVMAEGARPPGLLHNWPVVWRLTAFKAFAYYIKLLIWPVTLSGDYLFNQIPLTNQVTDPLVLLGLILFFGILSLGVWALMKGQVGIAFGIFFFYAAYAPVSNLAVPIGALVGERLLYLPSLGFCIVVAILFKCFLDFLKNKTTVPRARNIVMALFVVLVVAYGSRAFARNFDWKNPYVFFRKTSRTSPNSAVSHYSTAVAYLRMVEDSRYVQKWMDPKEAQKLKEEKDRGRSVLVESGMKSISRALEITKDHPNAKYLGVYGTLLAVSGRLEEARKVLLEAVQRNGNLIEAKINLGVLCMRLASKPRGKASNASEVNKQYLIESVKYLQEVERQRAKLREKPVRIAEVYFNLAIAQEKMGRYDDALESINNAFVFLEKAIERTGEGHFLLGRLYLIKASILTGTRDYDGAVDALAKAKEAGFPQFQRYVSRMRQLKPLHKHPGFRELIGQK